MRLKTPPPCISNSGNILPRLSFRIYLRSLALVIAAALTLPTAIASTFYEDLEEVDYALKHNPTHALKLSLESCLKSRNFAVKLNQMGYQDKAQRSLQYCFDSLQLKREYVIKVEGPTNAELAAKADKEIQKALSLAPDIGNGLALYRECAACHEGEGWGRNIGSVPQIAGQHPKVLIKQLADFRAGGRETVLMSPYATEDSIGGTQSLSDVAAYISALKMSNDNGKGPGDKLAQGESLYREKCLECHGETGQGDNEKYAPRIQAQHYKYMLRQFKWLRSGSNYRRNANEEMVALAKSLEQEDIQAVLDYVSRLGPEPELQAPAGWTNPDFAE